MENKRNTQDVNPAYTSDGAERSNLLTRDEFLRQVLYSGQLTRIAQHIAIVVFLVSEGRNQLKLSLRDLEKITGWDHKAVKDHITELEVFMRVTLGAGRAKAIWELQGVVEDALAKAVVVGSTTPQRVLGPTTPQGIVPAQNPTTGAFGVDDPTILSGVHVPANRVMYRQDPTNSFVAAHVATSIMAAVVPATGVMAADVPTNFNAAAVVSAHVPTKGEMVRQDPTTPLYRERESNIVIDISSLSHTTPHAREDAAEDEIQLNGVAIYGPGFKVSYAAIDQAAMLIGMPSDRARAIAEICARDWASNKKAPGSPMAVIKRALKSDQNDGQIHDVRMEKARADHAKPKESREARMLRHVEEQAQKKGGRS